MQFDEVLRTFSGFFEREQIRAPDRDEGTSDQERTRRVSIDVPDIEYLLTLPGVDRSVIQDYFERAGLLRIFDVIEKDAGR